MSGAGTLKKLLMAALAAMALSGCIFDDEWYDCYDCYDDSDGEYFAAPPASIDHLRATPR